MVTIIEFCRCYMIRMEATRLPRRPDQDSSDEWMRDASHWLCVFTSKRDLDGMKDRSLMTYYSMGSAHKNPPRCDEVLDSLVTDFIHEGVTFEDWAGDFGYDVDSRKAERTYKTCLESTAKLREFLGAETEALLNNTERL